MSLPGRWNHTPTVVMACCALLALTLSTCTNNIEGVPVSQLGNAYQVAGLPAVDGPSGLRPHPKPANRAVHGSDDGEMDRLAVNAVADIEDFWQEAYPKSFWAPFHPVDSLTSWNSVGRDIAKFCNNLTIGFDNAGYCSSQNSLGWDRGALLPKLVRMFGPMAVPMTLAHEYGHALTHQAKMVDPQTQTLVSEQMADCLAGTYLRWVAQGSSPRFTLSTGEGLNKVIAALIAFRDDPIEAGGVIDAHGSAFERVSAFQRGFVDGATACTQIDRAEIAKRAGGLPENLPHGRSEGMPVSVGALRTLMTVLGAIYGPALDTAPPRLSVSGAACDESGRRTREVAAVYCPDSNTVALDLPRLTALARPTHDQGQVTGDFTAYSMVISRYALAVENQHGLPLDNGQSALRTACLTGVASAAMAKPTTPDDAPNPMVLTAEDLDEAVSGLLTNGIVASDVNGTTIPAGFSRIDAFRDGVAGSTDRCLTRYG
ncbi:peptidase [Mycobacterium sp. MHSD3]|uniref:peptidase n=1 Tax=Mycobacteroides chelonae TaxID=1774 RepID=UPI0009D4D2ED|nr:peptidase [Mycobacteroides chelonae]MBF9520669.1 peptidase [Mycobacteroides chelonae]PKQ59316.1 peptidase [Mycobacterium sp. MHSD3]SKO10109.1 Possible lipoprotein peptidase LpqM [Mycobacteroides abscessus subsp. bolletii]